MNLFHLKYFLKLAELEHYTLAAKELNITQPSLSHAISTLEDYMQVKLFEKKGRNISLTKSGEVFYSIIKSSISNIDEATELVKKIHDGHGLINIGFVRTLGVITIPTLCRQFIEAYPDKNINYNLHAGSPEELTSGLKSGTYDIILTSEVNPTDTIEYLPLGEHELILITAKDHELSSKSSVKLKDILDYDFIGFKNNTELSKVINPNFERINMFPRIKYVAEEEPIIAGLVAQNFGIAIVPDVPILDSLDIVKIKIEDILQNRLYYLAYSKNKLYSPLIHEFINYIRTHNFSKYIKFY